MTYEQAMKEASFLNGLYEKDICPLTLNQFDDKNIIPCRSDCRAFELAYPVLERHDEEKDWFVKPGSCLMMRKPD